MVAEQARATASTQAAQSLAAQLNEAMDRFAQAGEIALVLNEQAQQTGPALARLVELVGDEAAMINRLLALVPEDAIDASLRADLVDLSDAAYGATQCPLCSGTRLATVQDGEELTLVDCIACEAAPEGDEEAA